MASCARSPPTASLGEEPREIDLEPVYALLREHIAELNVEGAATMGDRLWLLQRGSSELGSNVVAELSLDQVLRSLREDLTIDADELENVRSYDLGDSTASRSPSATAHPDRGAAARLHRVCRGGRRGASAARSSARSSSTAASTPAHERRRSKVEGVHAAIATGVLDFTFVCDQDDPDTPSPLLAATMPVEGGLEYVNR